MIRAIRRTSLIATLVLALPLEAQDAPPPMSVKTITLHHMRSVDAAKLVSPYVQSPLGGVFDVGGNVAAITVRERAQVIAVMDSVLREHDRAPEGVTLRFQLIATSDSVTRDPAIESVDAALRSLFKFTGYRLIAQGTAITSERQDFALTMADGQRIYRVSGRVGSVDSGPAKTVPLTVDLAAGNPGATSNVSMAALMTGAGQLFETGITVPLGQTVVLGSGAPSPSSRVLILVVQPELQAKPKR